MHDHEHFTYDGPWQIGTFACADCGKEQKTALAYVLEHGNAKAVVHLTRDAHDSNVEAIFEMTLGSFEDDEAAWNDNVTFSSTLSSDDENWKWGFITPDLVKEDIAKVYGAMLSRDEALAHPWLGDVKGILSYITETDEFERFMQSDNEA